MKIARVAFNITVQCAGSVTGASSTSASAPERAGSTPFEIDLVEVLGIPHVRLRKTLNGKLHEAHVPIFNVSFMHFLTEAELAAAKAKEEAALKAKVDAEVAKKLAEEKKEREERELAAAKRLVEEKKVEPQVKK